MRDKGIEGLGFRAQLKLTVPILEPIRLPQFLWERPLPYYGVSCSFIDHDLLLVFFDLVVLFPRWAMEPLKGPDTINAGSIPLELKIALRVPEDLGTAVCA